MSASTFVNPHAAWAVWPITTPGVPGDVKPAQRSPSHAMSAAYQVHGAASSRCGSFASNGAPVVVRSPESTQLFEPAPSAPPARSLAARARSTASPALAGSDV